MPSPAQTSWRCLCIERLFQSVVAAAVHASMHRTRVISEAWDSVPSCSGPPQSRLTPSLATVCYDHREGHLRSRGTDQDSLLTPYRSAPASSRRTPPSAHVNRTAAPPHAQQAALIRPPLRHCRLPRGGTGAWNCSLRPAAPPTSASCYSVPPPRTLPRFSRS